MVVWFDAEYLKYKTCPIYDWDWYCEHHDLNGIGDYWFVPGTVTE